jgi:hypothetical protein
MPPPSCFLPQVQEELEVAVEEEDTQALESIKEQLAAFAEVMGPGQPMTKGPFTVVTSQFGCYDEVVGVADFRSGSGILGEGYLMASNHAFPR